ncbi:hypothetical protein GCK32_012046 [Trichostrongylus colubriformis]|uniref:mitogen-activated protein kinase kinase n=1 Tax=Trichostrongylus colubriformis TaxID=6319 RepID=A0AAN8IA44_TRICO
MICMEAMATCLDLLLKRTGNEPIPEPIVGKMSVSVVRALDYLKENHNVIHRDVKPSNILLDWNGVVKLCDFGISGFLIESRAKSKLAGCPPYMAPERVRSTENTPLKRRSSVVVRLRSAAKTYRTRGVPPTLLYFWALLQVNRIPRKLNTASISK